MEESNNVKYWYLIEIKSKLNSEYQTIYTSSSIYNTINKYHRIIVDGDEVVEKKLLALTINAEYSRDIFDITNYNDYIKRQCLMSDYMYIDDIFMNEFLNDKSHRK